MYVYIQKYVSEQAFQQQFSLLTSEMALILKEKVWE